jgi:hypothetical protein
MACICRHAIDDLQPKQSVWRQDAFVSRIKLVVVIEDRSCQLVAISWSQVALALAEFMASP